MKRIVAMGEALIDFVPIEKGVPLSQVNTFKKMPGGAPANVCSCVAKLGGKSSFMGMIGKDEFGSFLKTTLISEGVDVSLLKSTSKAKTGLAFVSLTNSGERDFIFYRDPSADQLFTVSDVNVEVLNNSIFHFCSVSLSNYPIKDAHLYAIKEAKKRNGIISFDPNIRLHLWSDHIAYRKVINQFIPFVDVLKISDDEFEFITGKENEQEAVQFLLQNQIKYLIITKGKKGVTLYTKTYKIDEDGINVEVKDTTGAGDAWIGAFLYQLSKNEINNDNEKEMLRLYLRFSNATAALTTTKYGAISALPTLNEINKLTNN
ncbi:MAG: carbohydrate kinase [Tenericutes bacterium]|nr:carbohydrate kinase [Mycoplasmatota bacterium]